MEIIEVIKQSQAELETLQTALTKTTKPVWVVQMPGGYIEQRFAEVRLAKLADATCYTEKRAQEIATAVKNGNGEHGTAIEIKVAAAIELEKVTAIIAMLTKAASVAV